IPLSGRNWVDLVMLAPGSRANEVGTNGTGGPVARTGRIGGVHGTDNLTMDARQVTRTDARPCPNPNVRLEPQPDYDLVANLFHLNSSTDHPSAATHELAKMIRVGAQLTQASSRAVNILAAGVFRQYDNETSYIGNEKVGKIQFNNGLSIGPGLTDVGRTPF